MNNSDDKQIKSWQLCIGMEFHFHGTEQEARNKVEEDKKRLEKLLQVEYCGSGLEYQPVQSYVQLNGTVPLEIEDYLLQEPGEAPLEYEKFKENPEQYLRKLKICTTIEEAHTAFTAFIEEGRRFWAEAEQQKGE